MLRARSISKSYRMGRSVLRVLRGASLDVGRGEFLAVTGPSGSGKSTLLHILGALDPPDSTGPRRSNSGTVELDGHNLFDLSPRERDRVRNLDIGFVFQFYHLLPELTVFENVLAPGMVGHSLLGWFDAGPRIRRDTQELLERMKLDSRASHRPKELSGGERQRVAIARALVNKPKLLLADEPTGNLDEATGRDILDLLIELNEAGQTIVMVTHNADVASLAHRCVQLKEGKVAASNK